MTKTLTLVVLAALALPAQAQKSYKCLDARGVTQYTQTPSTVCKDKPVEIKGPPPVSTGGGNTGVGSKPPGKLNTETPAKYKAHENLDIEGALRAKTRDPKRPH
jgi:hypothetical protein